MKGRRKDTHGFCNPCSLHSSFEMIKGNELFAVTDAHGSVCTGKETKVNCIWKQNI